MRKHKVHDRQHKNESGTKGRPGKERKAGNEISITIGSVSVGGQSRNRRREGDVGEMSIRRGSSKDEDSFYRCVVWDPSSVRNRPSSVHLEQWRWIVQLRPNC